MSTSAIVTEMLEEYRPRLGIDSSAKVLALNTDMAEAVQQSMKAVGKMHQPTVITDEHALASEPWKYGEVEFSHIFASFDNIEKADLQHLKWIQYSLRYNGLAILLVTGEAHTKRDGLVDWIEGASFERGRIRVLERGPSASIVLTKKWDALSA